MRPFAIGLAVVLATGTAASAFTLRCDEVDAIRALCGPVAAVVCIDDFQYAPAVIQVKPGDTVAWVNVDNFCREKNPPTGCDTHHDVLTAPVAPAATGAGVAIRRICSPNPGTSGALVSGTPSACHGGETNLACHTFTTTGVQHYTCQTNTGHTAMMHGIVIVR